VKRGWRVGGFVPGLGYAIAELKKPKRLEAVLRIEKPEFRKTIFFM
jgi:hypothetical protein